MKTVNLILFLSVVPIVLLFSQNSNRANIWYFGQNAGIDFNSNPPVPLTNGSMNTSEGCASICDDDGALLLYTDGSTIWNKNHEIMPNAVNLGGSSTATQSGIIVPVPGSKDSLYVFSVPALGFGSLRYSIVDMKLNGGLGGLVSSKTVLYELVTEKLVAIPKANNEELWLIAHEVGNNTFLIWEITETGISVEPEKKSIGSSHDTGYSCVYCNLGYMRCSPDGSRIALAIQDLGLVECFDFNNETAEISNPITITGSQYYKAYGVEFSPSGNLLYISTRRNFVPTLFQVNLDLPSNQDIVDSVLPIAVWGDSPMGAIQNGPDGKIYIAHENRNSLSVIHNPNELGLSCNFEGDGFYLGGKLSKLGLPNLIPSYFYTKLQVGIDQGLICVSGTSGEIEVNVTGGQQPYEIMWGDGSVSFTREGLSTGTYTFTVTDANEGIVEDTVILVQGDIPDCSIFVSNPTQACGPGNGMLTLCTVDEGYDIEWSTGETGIDIDSLSSGEYSVTITGPNGCQSSCSALLTSLNSLGNYVWYDSIANGIQDPLETGIEGIEILLYEVNAGLVATAISDTEGYYGFDNLPDGLYYIKVGDLPIGKKITIVQEGTDPELDSDVDPSNGSSDTLFIYGGSCNDLDIGLCVESSLGSAGTIGHDQEYCGFPVIPDSSLDISAEENGTIGFTLPFSDLDVQEIKLLATKNDCEI